MNINHFSVVGGTESFSVSLLNVFIVTLAGVQQLLYTFSLWFLSFALAWESLF